MFAIIKKYFSFQTTLNEVLTSLFYYIAKTTIKLLTQSVHYLVNIVLSAPIQLKYLSKK
jgi:hypothetical protein